MSKSHHNHPNSRRSEIKDDYDEDLDFDNTAAGAPAAGDKGEHALGFPSHEELNAKINELEDKLVRNQAELENIRRRAEREVSQAHKFALERMSSELIVVADNLERALEQKGSHDVAAFYEGVELTYKILKDTMEKFGIKAINPLGQSFDPSQQEAMSMQESKDYAPGTVLSVLQKGYMLHDRLLRPALVIVSKAAS